MYQPTDTDPVFSRDLLQVEILRADRSRRLLTVFVNHLKSKFCDFSEDPATCQQHNTDQRTHQATVAARAGPGVFELVEVDVEQPPRNLDRVPRSWWDR